MQPKKAPPIIIKAELIFGKLKEITKLTIVIEMVFQSFIDSFPILAQMAKIKATEAILTVSKNADIIPDFLNFGTIGFIKATNTKAGKKIPIVAAKAPGKPAICQPIKVAEEKTGPGVN